jgi:hypothetical protein
MIGKKIKRALVVILICASVITLTPKANALGVVDCFAIKSAGFERGIFGVKNYVVEFYSLCSMSSIAEVDKFSNTGLTFTATGPQKISSFVAIYNFNNYKTFTFKLGDAPSGEYRVQLDLWARSDDSRRTIYLPNLVLEDPIECIKEVSTSAEVTTLKETAIYVKLRNNCSDIPNKDFYYSKINLSLQISGFGSTEKQKIDTLSGIASTYIFITSELQPGTYYPRLIIDGYPVGKSIQLTSFVISPKSKPSQVPTNTDSATIGFELCSFSKNFDESCTPAPDWYFEFCAVYESSQLQKKVGSKWVSQEIFKAELKSDSCDKTNPNYFAIVGVSNSSKTILQFRMSHKATKKYRSSYLYFSVKPQNI